MLMPATKFSPRTCTVSPTAYRFWFWAAGAVQGSSVVQMEPAPPGAARVLAADDPRAERARREPAAMRAVREREIRVRSFIMVPEYWLMVTSIRGVPGALA
jgi:hypothetical protein